MNKLVTCSECKKELTYTSGTTNLTRHLKDRHNIADSYSQINEKPPLATSSSGVLSSTCIDRFVISPPPKPCSIAKQEHIIKRIVDWIDKDMRPLGVVNDLGFGRLLGFIDPSYSVPS